MRRIVRRCVMVVFAGLVGCGAGDDGAAEGSESSGDAETGSASSCEGAWAQRDPSSGYGSVVALPGGQLLVAASWTEPQTAYAQGRLRWIDSAGTTISEVATTGPFGSSFGTPVLDPGGSGDFFVLESSVLAIDPPPPDEEVGEPIYHVQFWLNRRAADGTLRWSADLGEDTNPYGSVRGMLALPSGDVVTTRWVVASDELSMFAFDGDGEPLPAPSWPLLPDVVLDDGFVAAEPYPDAAVVPAGYFIRRYDADFDVVWEKDLVFFNRPTIVIDHEGGFVLASDVAEAPSAGPAGHARVVRLDPDGEVTWDDVIDPEGDQHGGASVAIGPGGELAVVGNVQREATMAAWVRTYSPTGEPTSTVVCDQFEEAVLHSVAIATDGTIVTTGTAREEFTYDGWLVGLRAVSPPRPPTSSS